jgi:hypothetical protein
MYPPAPLPPKHTHSPPKHPPPQHHQHPTWTIELSPESPWEARCCTPRTWPSRTVAAPTGTLDISLLHTWLCRRMHPREPWTTHLAMSTVAPAARASGQHAALHNTPGRVAPAGTLDIFTAAHLAASTDAPACTLGITLLHTTHLFLDCRTREHPGHLTTAHLVESAVAPAASANTAAYHAPGFVEGWICGHHASGQHAALLNAPGRTDRCPCGPKATR